MYRIEEHFPDGWRVIASASTRGGAMHYVLPLARRFVHRQLRVRQPDGTLLWRSWCVRDG